MKKFAVVLAVTALGATALALPQAVDATTLGPQPGICDRGEIGVLVRVTGFRVRAGRLRVQLYAANPRTFLERGAWLQRIDVPVTASGDMNVCVPVAAAGRYAISVRHDANNNGDNDRADGGGFSGNPPVSLFDLALRRRPSLTRVAFPVAETTARTTVILNYVQGTRFEPIRN